MFKTLWLRYWKSQEIVHLLRLTVALATLLVTASGCGHISFGGRKREALPAVNPVYGRALITEESSEDVGVSASQCTFGPIDDRYAVSVEKGGVCVEAELHVLSYDSGPTWLSREVRVSADGGQPLVFTIFADMGPKRVGRCNVAYGTHGYDHVWRLHLFGCATPSTLITADTKSVTLRRRTYGLFAKKEGAEIATWRFVDQNLAALVEKTAPRAASENPSSEGPAAPVAAAPPLKPAGLAEPFVYRDNERRLSLIIPAGWARIVGSSNTTTFMEQPSSQTCSVNIIVSKMPAEFPVEAALAALVSRARDPASTGLLTARRRDVVGGKKAPLARGVESMDDGRGGHQRLTYQLYDKENYSITVMAGAKADRFAECQPALRAIIASVKIDG